MAAPDAPIEWPTVRARIAGYRLLLLTIWLVATLAALAVAATTHAGRIVMAVTTNHGVHAGDLVAFCAAYATALLVTTGVAIAG